MTCVASVRAIVIFVALSPTSTVAAQSATYSQRFSVGPVQLTHQRFVDVVKRVQRFAASVNDTTTALSKNEAVISDGSRDVRATGAYIDSLPMRAPVSAYSARYEYLSREGRVTSVDIELNDAYREVRVTGNSPESVDAIASMIRDDLSDNRQLIGGSFFRYMAGAVLLLLTMLSPLVFPQAKTSHAVAVQFAVFCVVFLLPWHHWLPGTGLYSANASWLVRNSPELGLLGIVLSILTFAVSPWLSRIVEARRKVYTTPPS